MTYISRRKKAIVEVLPLAEKKLHNIDEGLELLKKIPAAKFIESVDVDVVLGVDTKKSDQMVRGAVVLPHGTGRKIVVAVFADDQMAEEAKKSGADLVGLDDLIEQIKKTQKVTFDVAIAHPSVMGKLGQVARILGSKGLMPNPKNGTLTTDISAAIQNIKAGQISYRADKFGIVHTSIGRIDFSNKDLRENLEALVVSLKKSKPSASKGIYLKKVSLSSTMGGAVKIDISSLTL